MLKPPTRSTAFLFSLEPIRCCLGSLNRDALRTAGLDGVPSRPRTARGDLPWRFPEDLLLPCWWGKCVTCRLSKTGHVADSNRIDLELYNIYICNISNYIMYIIYIYIYICLTVLWCFYDVLCIAFVDPTWSPRSWTSSKWSKEKSWNTWSTWDTNSWNSQNSWQRDSWNSAGQKTAAPAARC